MRRSLSVAACASVRVWSVVRTPARESSTATAVPNEPAPITTARRAPGRATCARESTAGRVDAAASGPVSVLTDASVAVALRSRGRATQRSHSDHAHERGRRRLDRRRVAGLENLLQVEDSRVEALERGAADDRVGRHADLARARRDLGDDIAL